MAVKAMGTSQISGPFIIIHRRRMRSLLLLSNLELRARWSSFPLFHSLRVGRGPALSRHIVIRRGHVIGMPELESDVRLTDTHSLANLSSAAQFLSPRPMRSASACPSQTSVNLRVTQSDRLSQTFGLQARDLRCDTLILLVSWSICAMTSRLLDSVSLMYSKAGQ